jgi:5-(carboxyamino)imidazole ribonucleotide synthase
MLPAGSTIGIIGGGQLGRMLAMAAARLGYRVAILEPAADCPAAQVANFHICAAYDDPEALGELAGISSVVTYEFENVPVEAAEKLGQSRPVLPPPMALRKAQDRLVEKSFLNDSGIPTAEFRAVDSDRDLADALAAFGGSGVLKTRRLGYDGKGQRIFRDATRSDIDGVFAGMGGVPLILEALVPFTKEISVIAARTADGSVRTYDPAENVHRDGILRSSTLPAAILPSTASDARNFAEKLMNALEYVGVAGLEFFVLDGGKLLANEFAPRVHNSGHWTEAACVISQFEQHIRAIAGLPLGDTGRHSNCVMENLIAEEIEKLPMLAAETGVFLHHYGKTQVREGRKMGHFTRLRPL